MGDARNHFNQIVQSADKLKTINGPVYLNEESGQNFSEFVQAIETVSSLCGPIYMTKDLGQERLQ